MTQTETPPVPLLIPLLDLLNVTGETRNTLLRLHPDRDNSGLLADLPDNAEPTLIALATHAPAILTALHPAILTDIINELSVRGSDPSACQAALTAALRCPHASVQWAALRGLEEWHRDGADVRAGMTPDVQAGLLVPIPACLK